MNSFVKQISTFNTVRNKNNRYKTESINKFFQNPRLLLIPLIITKAETMNSFVLQIAIIFKRIHNKITYTTRTEIVNRTLLSPRLLLMLPLQYWETFPIRVYGVLRRLDIRKGL